MRLFGRLQEMESVSQAAWAAAYIALGNHEQALGPLEDAVTNPETISGAANVLYFLADNPFDDPALDGPRFQALFDQLRGRASFRIGNTCAHRRRLPHYNPFQFCLTRFPARCGVIPHSCRRRPRLFPRPQSTRRLQNLLLRNGRSAIHMNVRARP